MTGDSWTRLLRPFAWGLAAVCTLAIACTVTRPIEEPAPARPAGPPAEASKESRTVDWTRLGPFETGEAWFMSWDGGNKNGYAFESVRRIDGGIRYERRARWLEQHTAGTVYSDAWVNFDADKRLVSYVLHGPESDTWYSGRVVGDRLFRWRPGESPAEDPDVLEASRLVPGPFVGQVARLLPRVPHTVVDIDWFDPAVGKVKKAYLLVVQQSTLSMPPDYLDGWQVLFAEREKRIHFNFFVDESRKLAVQAEGTALNYGPRLFPTLSADEALRDLSPRLDIAEEEKPLVQAVQAKGATGPPQRR